MFTVKELRCEYLENPLGIDVKKPRFGWKLESNERGQKQTAYKIVVTDGVNTVWNSKKVRSGKTAQIEYNGEPLKSFTKYFWVVTVWDKNGKEYDSLPASFETAMMRLSETTFPWAGLDPAQNPVHELSHDGVGRPAPYLRKAFTIEKEVKQARVYATALGIYELYTNGEKVGNQHFAPGWTDYHKQLQYTTYDITHHLIKGENVIGAILGDGWYSGNVAVVERQQYGDYPLLLKALIRIEFTDGEVMQFAAGGDWKATAGPILYDDIQNGEIYDARLELQGWNKAGYDDSAWSNAVSPNRTMGKLVAQIGPGIVTNLEKDPLSVTKLEDKTFIVDMGQNMVGNVEYTFRANAGDKITLRYGEMINSDGSLYTENLRTAKQTDIYIAKGTGTEVWEPRFTFHGFRYVEIKGVDEVKLEDVKGKVIYSHTPKTGSFQCSSDLVNQLYSNITWGQRGNFVGIPTDCPQRDERMGWTGDAQVFVRTGCYNMDCAAFYTKYVRDMVDAQHPTGCFTDVVPYVIWPKKGTGLVGHGNTAWGDAGIIVPWTMYLMYGDKRVLEENYDAMVLHQDYMKFTTKNYIRPAGGYGDWLSVGEVTDTPAMNTAFFAYITKLMAKIANVLGKKEDAKKYQTMFKDIKEAFNKTFVDKDGKIANYTQTIYVMALHFDLLSAANRKKAAQYLVENIEAKGGHLATGFVGVGYLLPALTDMGYNDVAYKLITNTTYPSWGYSIVNGATTIWERWNSYTKETGFGDVGMNSFNHYSLGSCGEWMFRSAAGIEVDEEAPGFDNIVIKPHTKDSFGFVKASYESIHGPIVCNWNVEHGLSMEVSVPCNTTATIYVPCRKNDTVFENGVVASKAEGLKAKGFKDGYAVFEAVSGNYQFKVEA